MSNIRVLIAWHDKPAEIKEIENTLQAQQAIVGGYIEALPLDNNKVIIFNEEGRALGLPLNPHIPGVAGNAIIAKSSNFDFADLTPQDIDDLKPVFKMEDE